MPSLSGWQLDASTLQALRVRAAQQHDAVRPQQQLGDLAVKCFQPAWQAGADPAFVLPPREHDTPPDFCP